MKVEPQTTANVVFFSIRRLSTEVDVSSYEQ